MLTLTFCRTPGPNGATLLLIGIPQPCAFQHRRRHRRRVEVRWVGENHKERKEHKEGRPCWQVRIQVHCGFFVFFAFFAVKESGSGSPLLILVPGKLADFKLV